MVKNLNYNKELHVVYASDDKFAEILGVSLTSLYENNKNMEQIYVYILESKISKQNREKLNSLSKSYGRKSIRWIRAKDISEELNMEVAADRGSLSQYARLFVSSVLPKNLTRVLYLDCDIIIRQSLEELWNLDMHGKTIAALKDAFSRWYRVNIDLKPADLMFNSGVMLIDLKRWKEQNIERSLMKFIKDKNGDIQQSDQGALNAVLSYDTYCFEPKFNSVTIYYDFSYKEIIDYRRPPDFYTEELIKEAVENPVIVHFTTSFLSRRPWYEGCCHRYVGEWLKYKNMSLWKDSPLWKYKSENAVKEFIIKLAEKMPRKLMIKVFGTAQIYGRPLFNRLKFCKILTKQKKNMHVYMLR
ncbi:MAG: glycosyltransferase family 8 protein [Eubacterium sp.]|nr:glycosyltransferase family 8 protein [Eubacterium sp.]